jgi:hypothetical protein
MKLSTLKLTNAKRAARVSDDVQRRTKLVKRLQEQRELARAAAAGQRYAPEKTRWVRDDTTGERTQVVVGKRVKQWWFDAEDGRLALSIRYGSGVLELAKGKFSIDVADITQMADTIDVVSAAVAAGELDAQIASAAQSLRKAFKK